MFINNSKANTARPPWAHWSERSGHRHLLGKAAETGGQLSEKKNTIWLFNIAMGNPLWMEVLVGKSSINGQLSMAMLNNQRVGLCNFKCLKLVEMDSPHPRRSKMMFLWHYETVTWDERGQTQPRGVSKHRYHLDLQKKGSPPKKKTYSL